jgi:hypothetical protein
MWLGVGAHIFWRMLTASLFLVALATLVLAPDAMAHGSPYTISDPAIALVVTQDGGGPLAATNTDMSATTYVQSATWKSADSDESCPSGPGHSHPEHSGCCSGIVCCVSACASGCGAMFPPEDPVNFFCAKTLLLPSTTLLSVGVGTIPTDPPPRLLI